MKALILILVLGVGLSADSPKERALKQQLATAQITIAAKDLDIRNLQARIFTLQATLDSTGKASQALAKSNADLVQHNAAIIATQTAAQTALVGEVASTKSAFVAAKVDSAKILQVVDNAKVAAIVAKRAVVIADKKRDDQHAEQQAATKALMDTADNIKSQLLAEHGLNEKMDLAILQVEGLLRGAQRILFISLLTVILLLITCFLLLRGQFKRRHSVTH